MRYFLNFKSDNYGKKEIVDPWGMDKVILSLKQKPNGMGRDISFAADSKNMFEFSKEANHEFDYLLYYNRKFGFESDVDLIVEVDENNTYICNLDFSTADTDDFSYFKCMGIEDSKLQIINSRKTTKVDVFASTDIDGNYIEPLVAENMFINATPIVQSSKWEQVQSIDKRFVAFGTGLDSTLYVDMFPCQNLAKSEINDSYTFFELYRKTPVSNFSESQYKLFTAKTNVKNVQIKLSDILIHFETDVDNGGNGYVDFQLIVKHGVDFATATTQKLIDVTKTEHKTYDFSGNFNVVINEMERGDSLWIYFYMKVRQSANSPVPFVSERFEVFFELSNMVTEITLDSIGFSSIAPSLRLIDVMRQVVKSISGLEINAARFDVGTILYDQRLTNGNLLRGKTDKPFRISLEDLEKSFNEFKGDYEIGGDGKVFFGIEEDFYTNNEMMFFPQEQFSEMHKTYNPKCTVNEFQYLYKTFQSQKENELTNNSNEVHGESKYSFFSKKVENKKVVEIEWIRSVPMIEETRLKVFDLSENTSTQEDDSLFVLDTIETTVDKSISDVYTFSHSWNASASKLELRTNGDINFVALGIVVGSQFIIKDPDLNAATYEVFSVINSELQLTRISPGANTGAADGIRQTKFIYFIAQSTIPFSNYTNQDFTSIENINGKDTYSNLRFSVRRNIKNYWNKYLASCNLYWKDKPIRNFWYKNNPDCATTYLGDTIIEGSEITPTNPILTPVMYEDIVFSDVDFEDFITLSNLIRSVRGYIRAIDNNYRVIKLYPVDVLYSLKDRTLSIKAEEKYEPTSMTIAKNPSYIEVNGEVRVNSINYRFEGQKLVLLDDSNQRLYNPVYWMEVSINGAIPENKEILTEWLELLNV